MTLAEFQPYVEQAIISLEWETARARWRQELLGQREALGNALLLAGQYGVERQPIEDRLQQIYQELDGDVTADMVPVHPIRSVPMDLITAAVIRRILRLPPEFPILSIKAVPSATDILEAVRAIASRWQTPNGQTQPAAFARPEKIQVISGSLGESSDEPSVAKAFNGR